MHHRPGPTEQRTSSVIAANYQYLRQKTSTNVAIEKSRKTSRISKGLDPDAPKSKNLEPIGTL
jgi:hypothetical protein